MATLDMEQLGTATELDEHVRLARAWADVRKSLGIRGSAAGQIDVVAQALTVAVETVAELPRMVDRPTDAIGDGVTGSIAAAQQARELGEGKRRDAVELLVGGLTDALDVVGRAASLKAAARRPSVLRWGDFAIDLEAVEVVNRGVVTEFERRQPFALLVALALHPNEVRSYDELIYLMWGSNPPADARRNLYSIAGRLRSLLGASDLIKRVYSSGLSFVPPGAQSPSDTPPPSAFDDTGAGAQGSSEARLHWATVGVDLARQGVVAGDVERALEFAARSLELISEIVADVRWSPIERWRPEGGPRPSTVLTADHVEVNIGESTITRRGETAHLTSNQSSMVLTLARRADELCKYVEVSYAVWGMQPPGQPMRALKKIVRDIRWQLGDGVIKTMPLHGYRLVTLPRPLPSGTPN